MNAIISVRAAVKRFGDLTAVDTVDLDVRPGECVGLLGPNGAGKSTLLSLILGLRAPTSGTARVFGEDPRRAAARQRIGSTPQQSALPEVLRVREVLDFVASHYAAPAPLERIVAQFGLEPLLAKQCGSLSGGQQRRVAVALAFVGAPELVVLDEPTTGLDLEARASLWSALREQHRAGCTILVTSHHLEEIEALAERVVVVDGGRVLADDSLDAVLRRVSMRRVTLRDADPEFVRSLGTDGEVEVDPATGVVSVVVADSDDFVRKLVASRSPFRELAVRGATLEEAFLSITTAA